MAKLEVRNNWGRLEYYFEDKRVKEEDLVGQLVTVEFPDGVLEEHVIGLTQRNVEISDMGKRETVRQNVLVVKINYHGVKLPIELFKCNEDTQIEIYDFIL